MAWVKICGIRDQNDLEIVLDSDPDAVGFLSGQRHPSPDFISPENARHLASLVSVESVLVTHLEDPKEIRSLWELVRSDTVQIHSPPKRETLQALQAAPFRIIQALHVEEGVNSKALSGLCQRIVLDTKAGELLGGTGMQHDWSISRRLRQEFEGEVILAGGLSPDNLEEAKSVVGPAGFDVNSGVEIDGKKDPGLCREFVRRGRS